MARRGVSIALKMRRDQAAAEALEAPVVAVEAVEHVVADLLAADRAAVQPAPRKKAAKKKARKKGAKKAARGRK